MARLTKKQRGLITPWAGVWLLMQQWVDDASDDMLTETERACLNCTSSNCGWNEYTAAQQLLTFVQAEMRRRKLPRAA